MEAFAEIYSKMKPQTYFCTKFVAHANFYPYNRELKINR